MFRASFDLWDEFFFGLTQSVSLKQRSRVVVSLADKIKFRPGVNGAVVRVQEAAAYGERRRTARIRHGALSHDVRESSHRPCMRSAKKT